jgi:hypothetical protein
LGLSGGVLGDGGERGRFEELEMPDVGRNVRNEEDRMSMSMLVVSDGTRTG